MLARVALRGACRATLGRSPPRARSRALRVSAMASSGGGADGQRAAVAEQYAKVANQTGGCCVSSTPNRGAIGCATPILPVNSSPPSVCARTQLLPSVPAAWCLACSKTKMPSARRPSTSSKIIHVVSGVAHSTIPPATPAGGAMCATATKASCVDTLTQRPTVTLNA